MRRASRIGLLALALGPGFAAASSAFGPGVRRVARSRRDGLPHGFIPASINRNTGRPHEHKREIARRLRRSAN